MNMLNKRDAVETLMLIKDGAYNKDRTPIVVIDELLCAIDYLSVECGIWDRSEDMCSRIDDKRRADAGRPSFQLHDL